MKVPNFRMMLSGFRVLNSTLKRQLVHVWETGKLSPHRNQQAWICLRVIGKGLRGVPSDNARRQGHEVG
jgi:hypothetical protein